MKNGLEPKSHLDKEVPYPKHYDISREETMAGKAEMRRDAYEGDTCKQDDKYMPDL
jgi:hypothetical protein